MRCILKINNKYLVLWKVFYSMYEYVLFAIFVTFGCFCIVNARAVAIYIPFTDLIFLFLFGLWAIIHFVWSETMDGIQNIMLFSVSRFKQKMLHVSPPLRKNMLLLMLLLSINDICHNHKNTFTFSFIICRRLQYNSTQYNTKQNNI